MLSLPWAPFLAGLSLVYVALNLLFALAYLLGDGAIANARRGAFLDAFFFSVETLSTIGYGQMSPATLYGKIVMTVEALVGLMLVAVAAGLMFARFSRPTARVLLSKVAGVAPFNGVPTLSLRLANVRRNQILEAEVSVTFVRDEHTAEGDWIRRYYDLKLARQRSPIFPMTFTVMHGIDADSPLWNATTSSLAAESAEIVVTVAGLDETISRTVHARAWHCQHEGHEEGRPRRVEGDRLFRGGHVTRPDCRPPCCQSVATGAGMNVDPATIDARAIQQYAAKAHEQERDRLRHPHHPRLGCRCVRRRRDPSFRCCSRLVASG